MCVQYIYIYVCVRVCVNLCKILRMGQTKINGTPDTIPTEWTISPNWGVRSFDPKSSEFWMVPWVPKCSEASKNM